MEMNSMTRSISEVLKEVQRGVGFFASFISTYEDLSLAAVDSNDNNDSITAIASRIMKNHALVADADSLALFGVLIDGIEVGTWEIGPSEPGPILIYVLIN
jgi:hypothetical protein